MSKSNTAEKTGKNVQAEGDHDPAASKSPPVAGSERSEGQVMTDPKAHSESRTTEQQKNHDGNVMRHDFRKLSGDELATVKAIKDHGLAFVRYINEHVPAGREASIALTKIEEAVMWAVKSASR